MSVSRVRIPLEVISINSQLSEIRQEFGPSQNERALQGVSWVEIGGSLSRTKRVALYH
jgi:hypothetical protein